MATLRAYTRMARTSLSHIADVTQHRVYVRRMILEENESLFHINDDHTSESIEDRTLELCPGYVRRTKAKKRA